jgi:O-antigen ligase
MMPGALPAAPLAQVAAWSLTGVRGLVLWLAMNAAFSLVIYQSRQLATLHGLAVLSLGIWAALRWPPVRVLHVAGYIAAAEVLWRMSRPSLPWEFGKYALILVLALAIVAGRRRGSLIVLPLLYLLLLFPSALLTAVEFGFDLDGARKAVIGNLSGPVTLALTVWFCSLVKLSQQQLWRLFHVVLGPLVGVAAVTMFSTYTSESIRFTNASISATSGGFGPNQVSSMLGLGVLLAFLLLVNARTDLASRSVLFVAMGVLVVQSAMTFSRGGLYGAAGAAALGVLFLVRDSRSAFRLLVVAAAVVLAGSFIVLPRLNTFTGGALGARFENTHSTGRTEIMKTDLALWRDNPVFGVGPGAGKHTREEYGFKAAAAHTEQTRLLAEHGLLGLGSLLLLFLMAWQAFRRARTPAQRALVVSLVAWTMLYMLHAAMRLGAAGFVFGLAFAACRADLPPAAWFTLANHRRRPVPTPDARP